MATQGAANLIFSLGFHAGEGLRGYEVFLVLGMMLVEGFVRNDDFLIGGIVAKEDAFTFFEDADYGVELSADLDLLVESIVSGEKRIGKIEAENGDVRAVHIFDVVEEASLVHVSVLDGFVSW